MFKKVNFHKVIIGRIEKISFPELDLFDLPAKVDTGAFRSSIHAKNIKVNHKTKELSFTLLDGHNSSKGKKVTTSAKNYKIVSVKNSFGKSENRYEVKLKVKLMHKSFKTVFTLADRTNLNFPILLGRKLLSGRYIIDSSQTGIDEDTLKRDYDVVIENED
ncbi:ATP-dependent zinc protease [Candidatus Saccharibacteria bacterium]|nr:ATP-dependent zinc protease [Candidatus Saccharibacteria bacterium]